MRTRPSASLAPLRGQPARMLRIDVSNERATRLRNPFARDLAPIRLPGSDRTYEHQGLLRGLGLRWDPVGHAWHRLPAATARHELEIRFGLAPRVVRPIESFQEVALERKEAPKSLPTIPCSPSAVARHLPRDSSRTRFESRLAFGNADEQEGEEIAGPTGTFTMWETTSDLPDDSREESVFRSGSSIMPAGLGGVARTGRDQLAVWRSWQFSVPRQQRPSSDRSTLRC
jgi:hypothetical protein